MMRLEALRSPAVGLVLAFSMSQGGLCGDDTVLVSVDSSGSGLGLDDSSRPSVDGSGRFVAFASRASNLVAGDANGHADVFVYDFKVGRCERISVPVSGTLDGDCEWARISADGRWVAYQSSATNLVAGDTNGVIDVFRYDRETGTTELVSLRQSGWLGDGRSDQAAISADGCRVAFSSEATNLVPGDTNGRRDVFVRDCALDVTFRVSLHSHGAQGDHDSLDPWLSANGETLVFASHATNLVDGDTNSQRDVFLHEIATGSTTRVSVSDSEQQADGRSGAPRMSADGRWVCFDSLASNLVADDTNAIWDVFLRDTVNGTTERISVDSFGAEGGAISHRPEISSDARFIAFRSESTNLVSGDTNSAYDVFVHDRNNGMTRRVSRHSDGTQADADCGELSINGDGDVVVFASSASTLTNDGGNGRAQVFAHRRAFAESVIRASQTAAGVEGDLGSRSPSFDGRGDHLGFRSYASNLDVDDTLPYSDIFVWFLEGRSLQMITKYIDDPGNNDSDQPSMSPGGNEIVFRTAADNLDYGVPDTNGVLDIYTKYDHGSYIEFERVSEPDHIMEASGPSSEPSAGDSVVAFSSDAPDMIPGDTNSLTDVFLVSPFGANMTRVSVSSDEAEANGPSDWPSLAADEDFVAFHSQATNLVSGDTNGTGDIFVRDLVAGTTERVSVSSYGVEGDGWSERSSISRDGRYVAFDSLATNLVPGDTNGRSDIFLHDRQSGVTTRVSVDSEGAQSNGYSEDPVISRDGRYVAFHSDASNLAEGADGGQEDVFLHDTQTGRTTCISTSAWGGGLDGDSWDVSLSDDAGVIAFESLATNAVRGDTNGAWDVFVRFRCRVDFDEFGEGLAGTGGAVPHLHGESSSCSVWNVSVDQGLGGAPYWMWVGLGRDSLDLFGGTFYIDFAQYNFYVKRRLGGASGVAGAGGDTLVGPSLATYEGLSLYLQATVFDAGAPDGFAMSNGLAMTIEAL